MTIASLFDPEVMPVEVFVGATGYVVLMQEQTTITDESYLRIRIRPDRARALCKAIAAAAREAGKPAQSAPVSRGEAT